MSKQIFVNLPVKDLDKSMEFFSRLGFAFNPQFTDKNATCMVIDDNIFAMLLVEKFFRSFTNKQISDTTKSAEVILSISAESREAVDHLINKAHKAGAKITNATQDLGWLYVRGFEDLDGHMWELAYMDISKLPKS